MAFDPCLGTFKIVNIRFKCSGKLCWIYEFKLRYYGRRNNVTKRWLDCPQRQKGVIMNVGIHALYFRICNVIV